VLDVLEKYYSPVIVGTESGYEGSGFVEASVEDEKLLTAEKAELLPSYIH